ncbi:MAG: hypothetical protein M3O82_03750 [Verrucomicrobiota bacterium]|nr:hypothetical protein [Verrucomicrobiota bacterium]
MNFDEFQNQARLYVVGALDSEETDEFQLARREFGEEAEDFIRECRRLNSVFALSLRPSAPNPETRERILAQIKRMGVAQSNGTHGADHRESDS